MLAISPLENTTRCHDGRGGVGVVEEDNFSDAFAGGGLLEDIDFDDLFVGFDDGDDVLPDLDVIDPNELLGEYSASAAGPEESGSGTESSVEVTMTMKNDSDADGGRTSEEIAKSPPFGAMDQTVPEAEEDVPLTGNISSDAKPAAGSGKSSGNGKKKVKVDWTPELHRRFVQAVEQLGIDKAVPSRILEIMGIDSLTRHNIASHLQKYRSHRKHLLAREAEAAGWSHRRHVYGGGQKTRETVATATEPWLVPTLGFPPPPPPPVQPFPRPLHVWGHPTVDHAMMHMWPKHLFPSRPSPPPPAHQWVPQYHPGHYPRVHPGTPCFPPQRFPTPPVNVMQGIPPPVGHHPMLYRRENNPTASSPGKLFQLDLHPSKESIDAAIGDVLSKPWLPLPLGLKPPSVDGVLVELQRQGIAKIPPSSSCAS